MRIEFQQADNAGVIRGSGAYDFVASGTLKVSLDHLIVLAVGEHKRLEAATAQTYVVNVLAAVLVESNRLRVPLNLDSF